MPVTVDPADPPYTPLPPPWTLSGTGLVALYRRPPDAILDRWVPAPLRDRYAGGPAALMFVDYETSEAGPYRELLFVPGRFRLASRVLPVITRIVVSTWESVANGRLNWAIPKERADFDVERRGRRQRWRISQDGQPLADVSFRARGPRLPVTTSLLPAAWCTVAQPRGEELMLTQLAARGRSCLARIGPARFGSARFPDLGTQRPLLAAAVAPFRMVFPVPTRAPFDA